MCVKEKVSQYTVIGNDWIIRNIVNIGDVHLELRGFDPIGIMEEWNDGILGSEKKKG